MRIEKKLHFALFYVIFYISIHFPSFFLSVQPGYAESLWAETSDGRKIHIFFIKGDETKKRKFPVVLCHGIGAQGSFWYFDDNSLAHYLAKEGFDVFVPDLRGVGKTDGSFNFFFEDYIKDVSAVLKKVMLFEGVSKAHWVGHSMGGMVIYLTASRKPELMKHIASFTAVSSPYKIWAPFELWRLVRKNIKSLLFFLRRVDKVPFFLLSRIFYLIYPVAESLRGIGGIINLEYFIWNIENLDENERREAMLATGSISSRVLEKFIKVGLGFETFNFYLENLTPPSLFLVGVKDFLATPPTVKLAYLRAGASEKSFKLAGQGEGFDGDYGHVDIAIGKKAKKDVFPIILSHLYKAEGVEEKNAEEEMEKEEGQNEKNQVMEEEEKQKQKESREKKKGKQEGNNDEGLKKHVSRRSDYSFLLVQDFGLVSDVWEDFSHALEEKRISFFFKEKIISEEDIESAIDEFCSSYTSFFNTGVFHGFAGVVAMKLKENCLDAVFLIGVPIKNISSFYRFFLENGGNMPQGIISRVIANSDKLGKQIKIMKFYPFGENVDDILSARFIIGEKQNIFYVASTGDRAVYWWDVGEFMRLKKVYGFQGSFFLISSVNLQDELSHLGLILGDGARKFVIPFVISSVLGKLKK